MGSKPLPSLFTGPFESPGFMIWRTSNAWQLQQRRALKPFGLTHTQFVVLAVATWFGAEETMTQSRLSQLTGSDPMTVSSVIRALAGAGFIERHPHPDDARAERIVVSAKGQEVAADALKAVERVDQAFFEPLGGDTESLIELFKRLMGEPAAK